MDPSPKRFRISNPDRNDVIPPPGFAALFNNDMVVTTMCGFLPHAMHPTSKILTVLRLRVVCRTDPEPRVTTDGLETGINASASITRSASRRTAQQGLWLLVSDVARYASFAQRFNRGSTDRPPQRCDGSILGCIAKAILRPEYLAPRWQAVLMNGHRDT